MSRTARLRLFLTAAAVLAAGLIAAAGELPGFGGPQHPYGERAVAAGLAQRTANIVSSVNFDQRAFDTLGEESILFASVLGAGMLLRLARDERKRRPAAEPVLPTTRLFGATLLPITLLTGGYLVAHGQLSPGGGFQGGVVLATALHLAYVAADYLVLKRIRPLAVLDVADALAAGAFAALGLIGLASGAGYLANTLPLGTFNQLSSSGLVAVVNATVGVEVGSGVVVLLAHFLDQAVEVVPRRRSR
ncbi:sodium:proton antiporter [Streptomyces kaniharaensis]|uniref:Sodium:proton antiporter n=1 Tax=Streptomyces kaniharaensis TaxID=212423 RepID=A0A6N7KZ06_9ACTN|nr:MnhB domain-containing protein [Streptomyces kaniharaensis]MQS16872.1 sodium:proton antiporter [Streptomyces kaniharaensis]